MEMEREQKLAERDLRTQKVWAQRLAKEMHQDIVSVEAKRESMQVSPSAPAQPSRIASIACLRGPGRALQSARGAHRASASAGAGAGAAVPRCHLSGLRSECVLLGFWRVRMAAGADHEAAVREGAQGEERVRPGGAEAGEAAQGHPAAAARTASRGNGELVHRPGRDAERQEEGAAAAAQD